MYNSLLGDLLKVPIAQEIKVCDPIPICLGKIANSRHQKLMVTATDYSKYVTYRLGI
ncbi:MAG: hypothetical protein VKK42_07055 [Lyngbya sp.]|nr:hypothetical protein [Lyngbya sp.]